MASGSAREVASHDDPHQNEPAPGGPGCCTLDAAGRIVYLDRAAARLTGHDAAAARGRDLAALLRPAGADATAGAGDHPVDAALRDGETHRFDDLVVRHRDGTRLRVAGTCAPVRDRAGGICGAVLAFGPRERSHPPEERRYRSLVAATSHFVWRSDPEGRLVDISDAWLELVGAGLEEATGWGWLELIHPDDRQGYLDAWLHAMSAGKEFEHEYRQCRRDGEILRFIDRAVPVRDEAGAIVEWVGSGLDVTAQRAAEEVRRREREQYRTLVESTSAIFWQADPDTQHFLYVSPEAESLLGYAADRWTGEARFWRDHIHPEDRDRAPDCRARAAREGRQHTCDYRMIAADGRTVWLRDVVTPLTDGQGRAQELVGVMVDITSAKETERELEYVSGLQRILVETAEEFLTATTGGVDAVLTGALGRIGEYCGVDRSYMVRFDAGGASMSLTHEWCAPGIEPMHGHLVGRPLTAVPETARRILRRELVHLPRLAEAGPAWATDRRDFEAQGIRSLILVPVVAAGRVYGYVGFDAVHRGRAWSDAEIRLLRGLADVTGATVQQVQADRARRETEERFRAIAEHMPGAVYERVLHPDGRVELTYLSPDVEQVIGVDAQRAMADPRLVAAAVHPDDRPGYLSALERSARELAPLDVDHRIRAPGGGIRHCRLLGRPHRNEDGSVTWRGTTIDEPERVLAEERLRESRALQEIAGRAARVGGWVADLEHGLVHWSDEVFAIHDLEPGEPLTLDQRLAYYTPDSRERVRGAFEACAGEGTPYDQEAELVTAAGRRIWVRTIGEAVRGRGGAITQVRGALQDVTEQKEAQEEVRRLAERLTSTLESITDAFFTVDRDWRITYLNRQAEHVMDTHRDELLGHALWEKYPELVGTSVEREYRRAMTEHTPGELEFYYAARDIWFEIRVYPSEEGLSIYLRDITERKRAREEIEFLALYDPLTRLPNRRLLLDRLDHALATAARRGTHGAVLFLDLDNFKTLNDTLGHDIGDRMLQEAAQRLAESVRRSDSVARFGGDEFAVILEQLSTDRDEAVRQALRVGEKIRAALTRPYRLAEHAHHTTVSIGVTLFGDEPGDTPDDVMKRADLAMYQAKDAGRGTVRAFDPSMRAAIQSRVALEADLREALDRGEVVPHYQPQVDASGRLVGAEALARWIDPRRGPVSPAEFIPVAEESGLILSLGDAILESACRQAAAWAERPETAGISVAVNVSARQFHHPAFVERVRATMQRTGVRPEQLSLELTESLLLTDVEDTITKMTTLKAEGVRFSLDDFGTGYSSLAYLKRLPLDQLKIDQAFVRDALTDANDAAIVRTIIVLARTMGLDVVAEGVETEAVRAMLAEHGCRVYQGFLYNPALPVERFDAWARGVHEAPACTRDTD